MADTKQNKNENVKADTLQKKSCFIVTPIGQLGSDINQKAFGLINAVIKPVLAEFGYEPIAASDMPNPGSINKQIIIKLYEDELVIANLTGLNPNVMYELAVRHAVKKPVIIMAEDGTKLPFDLVDQRCIFYDDSLHGVERAKEALNNFLTFALKEKNVTNPIYDAIKEEQILKSIENKNEEPIKYLISRIDSIERALVENRNYSSHINYTARTLSKFRESGSQFKGALCTCKVTSKVLTTEELYNTVKLVVQRMMVNSNGYSVRSDNGDVQVSFPIEYLDIFTEDIMSDATIDKVLRIK